MGYFLLIIIPQIVLIWCGLKELTTLWLIIGILGLLLPFVEDFKEISLGGNGITPKRFESLEKKIDEAAATINDLKIAIEPFASGVAKSLIKNKQFETDFEDVSQNIQYLKKLQSIYKFENKYITECISNELALETACFCNNIIESLSVWANGKGDALDIIFSLFYSETSYCEVSEYGEFVDKYPTEKEIWEAYSDFKNRCIPSEMHRVEKWESGEKIYSYINFYNDNKNKF